MGLRLLNPARFPRARSPPASAVAEGTVGWAGGGGGSPYTRSSRRFLQTSMTACPAPAKTVVPASTKSTPSSASACPATAVAAARKVGTRCVPRVCCHGVGETPTGTLPSPCPFGGRHGELGRGWKSPAPSVMGSLFPASLPGVLGDRFPSPCPSPRRHGGLRPQLAQVPGSLLPVLCPPALLGGRGAGLPSPCRPPHQHPLAGGARLHQRCGLGGRTPHPAALQASAPPGALRLHRASRGCLSP